MLVTGPDTPKENDSRDQSKLSVLIPAYNEEKVIEETVNDITDVLAREAIDHELLIVNDNSTDNTRALLEQLCYHLPTVRYVDNAASNGYGHAVKRGLNAFRGECVAIVMADGSDDPEDLIRYYRKWSEGFDCVFGDRFSRNSKVIDYPWPKLCLNRIGNNLIRLLFLIRYKDISNAFKLYGRNVIEDLYPLRSSGFNLTVEMPLKAVVRDYSYAVIPNNWYNRELGRSKWKINETLSQYLSILFQCWLEQIIGRQDAHRSSSGLKDKQKR